MLVARFAGGALGVMVAESACPFDALVVAYSNASGVLVLSTHPSG